MFDFLKERDLEERENSQHEVQREEVLQELSPVPQPDQTIQIQWHLRQTVQPPEVQVIRQSLHGNITILTHMIQNVTFLLW